MVDLISVPRARQQIPDSSGCTDAILRVIISACTGVIEARCRRIFAKDSYDQLYTGSGGLFLYLDNPPVERVAVRTQLMAACYITCNNPSSQVQKGNIEVNETGVILTRLFNNTLETHTFTYEDYPLFGDLATAINLIGGGWRCNLSPQFSKWQTSDMAANQFGIYSALNASIPLQVYWYGLPQFQVRNDMGELYNIGGWIPSYEAYRITYDGGFDPIPEDIQYACAALVQLCYAQLSTNPLLNSETIDKYSYTRTAELNLKNLDPTAQMAIQKYTIMRVARYK